MKRKWILLVPLGIILISIGLLVSFIMTSNTKYKELKENTNAINDEYNKLEEQMQIFNGERQIISEISNNYYDEQLEYNYSSWINSFNDYLNSVNNINNYKDLILNKCIDKTYTDTNVTSKCQSLIINYETAINYFVKDVNSFNKFLNEYNETVDIGNKKEVFDLKEYNYVDINDDGKYLGM